MTSEPMHDSETIRWVRKRDQTLAPCDRNRLRDAILAASEDAGRPLAIEEAEELTSLVLFMAAKASDGGTVDSEELADWVVKSLENTGQHELAEAYDDFARRRAAFRARVRWHRDGEPADVPAEGWDKGWLRRLLEERTTLSAEDCALVARRVERALVRMEATEVSDELICALANVELRRLDFSARITPPGTVYLKVAPRDRSQRGGPEAAAWAVAETFWREQSLAHELPADVIALHQQATVQLEGPWVPGQLAGVTFDAAALTRQAASPAEFLPALGRALAELRPYAGRLLAMDLVDVAIGLCTSSEDEAYELAEAVWAELQTLAVHSPVDLIVNLYARVPPRAHPHVAPGPLFRAAPDQQLLRRVRSAATVLLDRFRDECHNLPRLTFDFHWVPEVPDRLDRPAHAALAIALTGGRLRFVLDRYVSTAGDGLLSGIAGTSLLVVHLDMCRLLLDSEGDPGELLRGRFEPMCELTLRAAVRRREQLREQLPLELAAGRRLQQAALLLCPVGLDAAVRRLTGYGIADHPTGMAAAVAYVDALRRLAERLGNAYAVPVRIDRARPTAVATGERLEECLAGVTSWGIGRGLREQIYRTGQVHRRAKGGTLLVPLPRPGAWAPETVSEALNWAYETSSVVRIQFVPHVSSEEPLWRDAGR